MLYYNDFDADCIKRVSLDGINVTTIHDTFLERLQSLTLDIRTQTLYWAADIIGSSQVDGTNRINITADTSSPFDVAIDSSGNRLYYSAIRANALRRVDLTDGSVSTLTTISGIRGIALVDPIKQLRKYNRM